MSEKSGRPFLQERSLKPLTSLKRLNTFPNNMGDAFKLGPDQDVPEFNNQELESLRLLARSLINQKQKGKKRSYTREEKLRYIQLYKNTYVKTEPGVHSLISKRQAAKNFGISHSMFIDWLRKKDQLRSCKSGTRSMNNKPPLWPELEEKIYGDFVEWRKKGRAISKAWFLRAAKRYFCELYPNEVVVNPEDGSKTYGSKFSSGWFQRFKERWRVSWRAKTRIASKTPTKAEPLILNWLRFNRRMSQVRNGESSAEIGRYYRCDFYNMDQIPLPFEFLEGKTYEIKGNKTIWVRTIRNGWHKRQATLMIAICADGNPRIDPLIIFRGTGKGRDILAESKHYHPGVRVEFNEKAYSNEEVTLRWIYNDLKWATDFDLNDKRPRFIALDVFKAQKTPRVLKAFSNLNFVTSFIPEGCTSYVQPLDTHINKIFKNKISDIIDEEFEKNPEKWDNSAHFSVGDRRILITYAVARAWAWLHNDKKQIIIKSFRDCGLTLNVDGSEDKELRIKDLSNIEIGDWRQGGLRCNLDKDGHTGTGLIDLDVDESGMFDDNFSPDSEEEEEEEGEYILENDPHSLNTIRQWAERVKQKEAQELLSYEEIRRIMSIKNLCN